MEKKKWVRPKLIVLVRGHPAESVLATCKRALPYTPSPPSDQCIIGYHRCKNPGIGHSDPNCDAVNNAFCDMFGYDGCYLYDCCPWARDLGTCYTPEHQQLYCTRIASNIIGNS